MKYTTKIFGSILVMVLIMTLSPAQSMEMTTSHELAESGIIINFFQKPDASSAPPTVTGTTNKPQTVAPPPLYEQKAVSQTIRRALATLSEPYQTVLILHYMEGYRYR